MLCYVRNQGYPCQDIHLLLPIFENINMKTKYILSLLSLATCAATNTSAFAQSTVTFKGEIVEQACGSVSLAGGDTVTLPQQSRGDFAGVGSNAGQTPFSVDLDNCQPSSGTFALNFSNASADSAGVITNTGVSGIGYELINPVGEQRIPFTSTPNSSTGAFDANTPQVTGSGPHTLNYAVRYIKLDTAVGTGVTNAVATMTVQYN